MFKINDKYLVHTVLGHSYIMYVVFFCVAILIEQVAPFSPLPIYMEYVGIGLVCVGTILALWAQSSSLRSRDVRFSMERTYKAFTFGPYAFFRTPTQVALFCLMSGVGFVFQSIWIVLFALIAFILGLAFFSKKQQKILADRYGESYKIYQSKVRF